jgi:cysteine desulfurase/selenocysteine lyase
MKEDMTLNMDSFHELLSSKTKIVAISHASNVLGVVNPVEDVISAAHSVGAVVLLDACQSVPNMQVDVQKLDADFIVASSHKMCGPTGIGFLYGKLDVLKSMPPVYGGGEMIDKVELQSSTYALPPARFEPGTPAIAEAVGLGAACEYLSRIGMNVIHEHETKLGKYLYEQLETIEGLQLYGPSSSSATRTGLVAFNSKDIHASDLSFFLDQEGVALRSGHHCTQPLHSKLGAAGSIRASVYFYNNQEDIDTFIEKLKEVIQMFKSISGN